jgi:undecaprenyl-phosphate galactose phosphotransferase
MSQDAEALYYLDIEALSASSRLPLTSRSKRCLDLILAVLMIILALPLISVLYCLVRLDGGPAFFKHSRIGASGRTFNCWKFRTMVMDGDRVLEAAFARNPALEIEWRATHKLRNDPRVTRIGRILRALSLDELPQLFNVVMKDMSLVGPRPITAQEIVRYGCYIGTYYEMRPGITGLWQVSGRSNTSYERRVELDVRYAREWSLMSDISILFRTIPAVLGRSGAH